MYKTLTNNKSKLGTIKVKLEVDSKALQLAILEERYKMKVRIINDLNNEKLKQTKELNTILNKIYKIYKIKET